jgi:hypothetical protein
VVERSELHVPQRLTGIRNRRRGYPNSTDVCEPALGCATGAHDQPATTEGEPLDTVADKPRVTARLVT